MRIERRCDKRLALTKVLVNQKRNRHRAGWRFLRFTMIVTVNGPICKVIRMRLTPFRVVWPTACRSCSAWRNYSNFLLFCQQKNQSAPPCKSQKAEIAPPVLDRTDISAIMSIERRCDKRLARQKRSNLRNLKKPSLCRVAVSAFHNNRHGIPPDM